jgi:putative tryptophan/tyrosine transport system substrate-binding protein
VIDRRTFLAGTGAVLLAAPLAAEAQQAGKVWRIGLLSSASSSAGVARLEAFRHGLHELGYREGQNLAIEYRWAEGREDHLSALAADLVRLRVDLIVTQGTLATLVARRTTATIPIVFAVAGDPLGAGLVASLARPGGNVTGLAVMGSEMTAKRLELLREVVPTVTRIAALWNPGNPSSIPELKETETAARALGMQIQSVEVRDARMLDRAFTAMARERARAVIVLSDSMLFGQRKQIADLAAQKRLPGIAWTREFAENGGVLMVYGPDVAEMHRRAATYVDRILKGTKPGDLPVEQPTKFELVINLKTAKALGLTIPPSLLRRADEVIQ